MAIRTPPCGNYGDLDNDGKVSDVDAGLLDQYSKGTPFNELNTSLSEGEFLLRANVSNGAGHGNDIDILLDFLQWKINSFPICDPTGTANITFISSPTGADVSITKVGGSPVPVGTTNVTMAVVAGVYRVIQSKSGYSTSSYYITVISGEDRTHVTTLTPVELADFKILSASLNKTIVKPGERINGSATVVNNGSLMKDGVLNIYLDELNLIGWYIPHLASGAETNLSLGLDIPLGAALGIYDLKWEAVPQGQTATDTLMQHLIVGYETAEHDVTFEYPAGATLTID